MALSSARTVATAQEIAATAQAARDTLVRIEKVLAYNSHQSIDWAAQETPSYIPEDGDGNIDGLQFSRTAVANAVFSLEQLQKVLKNETTSKGDHLGNLNQIANP